MVKLKSTEDETICRVLGEHAEMILEDHGKLKQVSEQLGNEKTTFQAISDIAIENSNSDIKLITAVRGLKYCGR